MKMVIYFLEINFTFFCVKYFFENSLRYLIERLE